MACVENALTVNGNSPSGVSDDIFEEIVHVGAAEYHIYTFYVQINTAVRGVGADRRLLNVIAGGIFGGRVRPHSSVRV